MLHDAVEIAGADDAPGIAELSRALIEHGLHWAWRPARVARAIAAPDTNVAVVRAGRQLAAFGIMQYLDDHAHLVLFAVRPTSQRQGVGTTVLGWLEQSAVVAGASRVRVQARRENVAARCFYNERGYHELTIQRRMYGGRFDGVQLEKWLRASPPTAP